MIIGLDGNEANVANRVGSGRYAISMLKQFSLNKEHDFTVYLKEKPTSDLPKGTDNFHYTSFGPKKLWTRFALPANLNFGKKLDIFFTLGHYGPTFSKVPYVVTIFDLSYLHYPQLFNNNDLYQLKNWSKHSIRNSKHIFAISKSTKEDIVKNYNVDPAKITVTYMGYNRQLFKPQSKPNIEKVKKKHKIEGEYIIFVGTLQPRKNLEVLIEAFSKIGQNDLSLVIVGKKGWLFEPIFKKINALKLNEKVIFTGFVAEEDLPPLISGASVYVLPSLWEGFGMPVIEAQACGTPVIVSNTSSLPEIIGDSGIKIDPTSNSSIATAIKKVISSKKVSDYLVEKGFKNVKRFSWEDCAAKSLQVLESL